MKKALTPLIILLTLILSTYNAYATIIISNGTGGGDWANGATWTPNAPSCGDTITILAGDLVNVASQIDHSGAGAPLYIIIDGTLDFNTNGMKLKLHCGSGITINTGAEIKATGGGGGANNKIEICGLEVWRTSDGTINGFATFGNPLPVKLISFKVEIENYSVKLSWITASEINNDFFTIERSKNGIDFEFVTEIPGNGNNNDIKEYSDYDDFPLKGTSYYRLKQTDFDGETEYFKLVAINNTNKDNMLSMGIYPNPCIDNCTIELSGALANTDQINIELFDAFGKRIENGLSRNYQSEKKSFRLNSANNLAPGIYIVKSFVDGQSQSSKLIIQ